MSPRHYLISVDIEGITGVANRKFADVTGSEYATARTYMTSDTNAVIAGILNADPDATIVVRDAHAQASNLDLHTLHPKARLLQGWGTSMSMVQGLGQKFAGVFLVGYHAGAANTKAAIAHTYSSFIRDVRLNDSMVNEAGIAALCAAVYEIPVAFLSGDDQAVAEAKQQLPGIVTVSTKTSFARDSALSLPLNEAAELLTSGAAEATEGLHRGQYSPLTVRLPATLSVALHDRGYDTSRLQALGDLLSYDPGFSVDRERGAIVIHAAQMKELFQRFDLLVTLIYAAK